MDMETLQLCDKCHYGYITDTHTCKTEEELYREAFPLDIPWHEEQYKEYPCTRRNCIEPAYLFFENVIPYCLEHYLEEEELDRKKLLKYKFVCFWCGKRCVKFINKHKLAYIRGGTKMFCSDSCYAKSRYRDSKRRKEGKLLAW